MSLKRVNFSPLHTFARATVKNVFQPEPDGFGGTKYILKEVASGAPAFEWNPATGEPLGLSIHEARTNIATRNKADANALDTWTKTNVTVDVVADPQFGNVIELTDDATDGFHLVWFENVQDNQSWARSVRVKKPAVDGNRYLSIGEASSPSSLINTTIIDLDTGEYTQQGSAQTPVFPVKNLGNGWYEIGFARVNSSVASRRFHIGFSPVATGSAAALQYSGTGSKLLIALPQIELGTFATPPIETEATTVTRLADVVVINDIDDSEWWNPSEGTFVFDAYLRADHGVTPVNSGFFQIGTDTSTISSNSISLFASGSTAGRYLLRYGSISAADLTGISGSRAKIAVKYTATGTKMSINGSAVSAEVAASTDAALFTQAKLGFTSSGYLNSNIANFTYYPTAVSDAKLQELSAL